MSIQPAAPDVGTTFEYALGGLEPASYRVTAWLRERPWRASPHEMALSGAMVDEAGGALAVLTSQVVAELADEFPPRGKRMEFCLREVATHVSGAGVCGVIAPVAAIRLTGTVPWSEADIADDRAYAVALGRACELVV